MKTYKLSTSDLMRELTKPKTSAVSDETAKVFKLGSEIKQIKRETEYIRSNGQRPPTMPNFYKRLNIV